MRRLSHLTFCLAFLTTSLASADDLRPLLRELSHEVVENLMVVAPDRSVYGMAYEYKAMPDGPCVQAFGLDSMHDGAWMMSGMITAQRIDPGSSFLETAQKTFAPFYINILQNSDRLFPGMRPRKGQEEFTSPVKGWAPRGWDDGVGIDLVPFLKGEVIPFSSGINSHPEDTFVERNEDGSYRQSYHTSSHHLFQDLADGLLNLWLTTHDPAATESVRLIQQTRTEIGRPLPVVNKALDLMSGKKPGASQLFTFVDSKAFDPLWKGFVEKEKRTYSHYDDGLAWELRAQIAEAALREDGILDPQFVNHAVAKVYSMALVTKAFHGEQWQPGMTLAPGFASFENGKLVRKGAADSIIYARGIQLPWIAAAVLPAFRKDGESWNAAISEITPKNLEAMKKGLAASGIELDLDHGNVVAELENWIDGTIDYWSKVRTKKGYLPRMIKVEGDTYTWSKFMDLGSYAHMTKLISFRQMDLEDTDEVTLIRNQSPSEPMTHTPLPDTVLKAQGLR